MERTLLAVYIFFRAMTMYIVLASGKLPINSAPSFATPAKN